MLDVDSNVGVESLVERMVSLLFAGDSFARASPRISLPQDGQEGCLANFGGSRATIALSPTLLDAKLCCATWPPKVL